MSSTARAEGTALRSLNRPVAFAFGAVFVLVGLAGFLVSGGHHVAGAGGGDLLGLFRVNVLHNLVHLAGGAVLLGAAMAGNRAAALANTVFGLVYLAVFAVGLAVIGTAANILALNGADNVLHLLLGLALAGTGLLAGRR
ncbi:hypothetical protein GCM10010123_44820 [Pilimelia anulata]|uniref:DUF4383 domain-containing protein n=1 Tax=Pilimelia anulata TaxID=53371 RepID=A0A8J3FDF4_9ACTN|nr:DUF4383 domain-containing protein [Pilimelia anulata]GGK09939.1 hypothetical protein GCM10010123_44820 [Pilimelia anulata]